MSLSRMPAALALALLSASAADAAATTGDNYVPRFTRGQQPAQMLSFSTCTRPDYPKSSLRNEETGTAQLGFIIAPTGRIARITVEKSTGFAALDQAAIDGLRTCKFAPGSIDGKPVQSQTRMQYVWTLD